MKPWILAAAALTSAHAFAEFIVGPAEVLDKPYGRVMFTLNDGVKVECAAEDNHHQRIGLVGVISGDSLWGHDRTKKREWIFGLDGERIGETVRQVTLPLGKVARGENQFAAVFTGYVEWCAIDRKSEIEHALEPIVDQKLHPLTIDDLRSHLAAFGYKKGVSRYGYDTYVYRESWMDTPDPAPRLTLVFRANQFVAVLAKRDIHFMAHDPVLVREGYTLTYIESVDERSAARLETKLTRAILGS